MVSESTGDHGSGSVPSNVYSTGSVPSSFASSIYALIPSANQSSTSFASSEYISYESSAALLKPSVRKYLSVSMASLPTISLNVPEACLLDKSNCTILLCAWIDRKSTRLNSSHVSISYAVFCLKQKKQ